MNERESFEAWFNPDFAPAGKDQLARGIAWAAWQAALSQQPQSAAATTLNHKPDCPRLTGHTICTCASAPAADTLAKLRERLDALADVHGGGSACNEVHSIADELLALAERMAAPAETVQPDEREAFERFASDNGKYPKAVERSGNGYKLAQTHQSWITFQAAIRFIELRRMDAAMVGREMGLQLDKDRYPFTVDGDKYHWDRPVITIEELRTTSATPKDCDIFLKVEGAPDVRVGVAIELFKDKVSKFSTQVQRSDGGASPAAAPQAAVTCTCPPYDVQWNCPIHGEHP